MKKGGRSLLLLTLLVVPAWLHAGGLPVFDAVADAKKTWDTIQRTAAEIRAYAQMVKSYENDVRGVIATSEMVVQGGKQLASMPMDLSVWGLLAHYDSAVSRLSGMVDRGTQTMGHLYGEVDKVASSEGRTALLVTMKAERIRLMQILVSAQADQRDVAESRRRLAELVRAANNAEGMKAVLQAQANAEAMRNAHDKQVQAWHEALGKVQLLEKLEQDAVRATAALKAQEDAKTWSTTRPMAVPDGFNGFMLRPELGGSR